ncbi:MAG: ATP-binding cassette domain-containing protein [Bacteroidia bacterium]
MLNILFGTDNQKSDDQIKQFAQMADVWKDIESFPKQLETILGERGITLSGGQKQRVAITRALIREPEILVFDDSLSAIDTHTEKTIKSNLKKTDKHQTKILISHRVSTVEDAHHIIVLDNGKIVEQGNPQQLIVQKGLFAEMVKNQNAQSVEVV